MEDRGLTSAGAPLGSDLNRRKAVPKTVVVAVVAVVVLGTSGLYIWHEYYRHWSIYELENAAITEIMENGFPNALGFEQRLAGRTVTVEGVVRSTETVGTTLGQLTFVWLEGSEFCSLMLWDSSVPADGERVEVRLTFERGTVNGNEGVYSPQVAFPGYGVCVRTQAVIQSVSWICERFAIDVTDLGDEVVVEIVKASEPIPLSMVRCELRAGVQTGTMEYIDLLGRYGDSPDLDTITDLSTGQGLNGTITFTDTDGYLGDGDRFILRNLTRPESEASAQTYLLRVPRDRYPFENQELGPGYAFLAYIIMTKNGVLWTVEHAEGNYPAEGTVHCSTITNGMAFTVDYISKPFSWNDSALSLDCGWERVHWQPPEEFLESGSEGSSSLGIKAIREVEVECVVTDVAGNGLIDAGDRVEMVARNGTAFEVGERLEFWILDKRSRCTAITEMLWYRADPTSECDLSVMGGLASITLGLVHNGTGADYKKVDVVWGEVMVRLESGGDTAEWHLETEWLSGGEPTNWSTEKATLGEMSVACKVWDLQGNGAVNTGDRVEVAPMLPGDGFDPGTEYTVTLVYLPTSSTMFSVTFTGAG